LIEALDLTIFQMKKSANAKMLFELLIIKTSYQNNNEQKVKKTTKVLEPPKAITENKQTKQNNEFINKTPKIQKQESISQTEEKVAEIITSNKENDDNLNIFDDLIKLRIENTFVKVSKKEKSEIDEKLSNINQYILDTDYSELVSLLIDSKLGAVGNNHIVFITPTERTAFHFNAKLIELQKFLSKIFDKDYKIIAVDNDIWENYKNEYKNKRGNYKNVKEQIDITTLISKLNLSDSNNTEIDDLFGNIIEYE